MDNVFGIPMNTILIILAVIMGICVLATILIAIFNPVVFKMALRNPPRRKAQSILIVVGLMLATLIISAALTTGDTLDHSIKKISYDTLNRVDITVGFVGEAGGDSSLSPSAEPVPVSLADELAAELANDPDVEAVMPVLTVDVPAVNPEEQLSEPSAILTGLDWETVEQIGGISAPDGSAIDLTAIPNGQAVISESLAEATNTEIGGNVQIVIDRQPVGVTIAAIGQDSILTGILFGQNGPTSNGLAMALGDVQRLTGMDGQARYISITLAGGVEGSVGNSEAVEAKVEQALQGEPYGINPVKREAIENAELAGNQFMSIFLVLGLFSIAAGILLIFLIFLMLAAERRPEMGMARAVGMRQSSLVQQFLAEGTLYDLGSALIGALAGVGVAFVMVGIINQLIGEFFSITPQFTLRSLAVAYTLGVTVTFITIIFASARAARLNIVSAIRELPEPERSRERRPRWIWWRKIPRFGSRVPVIGMYWISLIFFPIEALPNLLIYPVRLGIWIVRVVAHYTGWGPLLTPVGILLMLGGIARNGESWSLALYSLGISVLGLGLMLILRRWINQRVVFTAGSLFLLLWWLTPEDTPILWDFFELLTPSDLTGDFEMFFISGVMMVTFATLLIMWNAEVMVWLVSQFGRAFARWVPAVKTAVAYPLASKTKTGLTLSMFSLIVFSLVTMSTLNANFVELFTTEQATAGWDVRVQTSPANPIGNLREELEGTDVDASQFEAVGRVSLISFENSEVRLTEDNDEDGWQRHILNGVNQEYAQETEMPLRLRAQGYATDADVWEAIANGENVAVIDTFSGGPRGFGSPDEQFFAGAEPIEDGSTVMEPIEIELSDPSSDNRQTFTIIGVIDDEISTAFGLYLGQQTLLDVYGQPDGEQVFVQLTDSSRENAERVAREIESALFAFGVQAESTQEQLETQAQIQTGFLDLIQGFMGLGLLVGIAALGVISFRAVVERRQQIGMLRAIGFQRNMVAMAFLLESLVVALLGVLSGVVLGLILSWNLINNGDVGSDFEDFIIPWTQIGVMLAIAIGAASLMTIIPSRNAAAVPVAEALRYE